MNKLVVFNGGYRTGSTLSFNIGLRIADCLCLPYASQSLTHDAIVEQALNSDGLGCWVFVKSHHFVPVQALDHVRVVHTVRSPFAAAVSMMLHQGWSFPRVVAELKRQRHTAAYLQGRSDSLVVPYQDLSRPETVQTIAGHLSLLITNGQAKLIHESLSVENVRALCSQITPGDHDPHTQLRHDQISAQNGSDSRWQQFLDPSQIQQIERLIQEGIT